MNRNVTASDVGSSQRPLIAAVDLFGLLQGMWRRKFLMLFVFVCVVGLTLAYLVTVTPKYTATAEVLIENMESAFTRTSLEAQPRQIDERDIASQVQVIFAGEIADRVVDELDLAQRPEFQPSTDEPSGLKKLLIDYRILNDERKLSPQRYAVETYFNDLAVYPVKGTNVISVEFTATDPETAAEVANAVANRYVKSTREILSTDTTRASEWLAGQIEELRDKVVASERAVEEYRTAAGLIQGRERKLSSESLTELNNQIIQATAQRAELQARAEAVRRALQTPGAIESSTEVLNSQLMQRLVERQVTLRGTRDDLLATLLPGHPRILAINSEIAGLDRQIRQEALKIASSQEQQAQVARARETALLESLEAMKVEAASAGFDEVKLRALEREATANRTLLETFLNRYSEANARESEQAQPSMARVISPASVPVEPSSPKPVPMLALALFGATILAMVVAFVAEIFSLDIQRANQRDEDTSDADLSARNAEVPLGQVPVLDRHEQPLIRALGSAESSADVAGKAAPVIAGWRDKGTRRILIGADGFDQATAGAIIETARALSRRNLRVVLVDMDTSSSTVAQQLGAGSGLGLAELLSGQASFSDTIRRDPRSELHILRGGNARAELGDLAGNGRMTFVINALTQAYDMVLLVPGPIVEKHLASSIGLEAAMLIMTPSAQASNEAMIAMMERIGLKQMAMVEFDLPQSVADSAAA